MLYMMYLTKPEALQGLFDLEILVSKKLYKKSIWSRYFNTINNLLLYILFQFGEKLMFEVNVLFL